MFEAVRLAAATVTVSRTLFLHPITPTAAVLIIVVDGVEQRSHGFYLSLARVEI